MINVKNTLFISPKIKLTSTDIDLLKARNI